MVTDNLLRLYQMYFDIFFTGAISRKQPAVLPKTSLRQELISNEDLEEESASLKFSDSETNQGAISKKQHTFSSNSALYAQGTVSNEDLEEESASPKFLGSETNQGEVEIKKFHVNSNIQIRYAITDVEAEMQNIHNDTWKAVFDMIIPKEAFVSKFVMVINGKTYEAKVKTKEVASSIFDSSEVTSGLVQSTTPPEFIDGNQVSKSKNECQTQNEKLLKAAGNIKLLGIKTESITVL